MVFVVIASCKDVGLSNDEIIM